MTTFRSTTGHIYDGGTIRLYYNIISQYYNTEDGEWKSETNRELEELSKGENTVI